MTTERRTVDRLQRGDVFFSRRGVRHTIKQIRLEADGLYHMSCKCRFMGVSRLRPGSYLQIEPNPNHQKDEHGHHRMDA